MAAGFYLPKLPPNMLCHRAAPGRKDGEAVAPLTILSAPLLLVHASSIRKMLVVTHLSRNGLEHWRGFLLRHNGGRGAERVETLRDVWRRLDGANSDLNQMMLYVYALDVTNQRCWAPLSLVNPFLLFSIGELHEDDARLTAWNLETQPQLAESLAGDVSPDPTPHDYAILTQQTLDTARRLQLGQIKFPDLVYTPAQGQQRMTDDDHWVTCRAARRHRRGLKAGSAPPPPPPLPANAAAAASAAAAAAAAPPRPTPTWMELAEAATRSGDTYVFPEHITTMDHVLNNFRLAFNGADDDMLRRVQALSDALMALPRVLCANLAHRRLGSAPAVGAAAGLYAVDMWVPYVELVGPYDEYRLQDAVLWTMKPVNVDGVIETESVKLWVSCRLLLALCNCVANLITMRSAKTLGTRALTNLHTKMNEAFARTISAHLDGDVDKAVGDTMAPIGARLISQQALDSAAQQAADDDLAGMTETDLQQKALAEAAVEISCEDGAAVMSEDDIRATPVFKHILLRLQKQQLALRNARREKAGGGDSAAARRRARVRRGAQT